MAWLSFSVKIFWRKEVFRTIYWSEIQILWPINRYDLNRPWILNLHKKLKIWIPLKKEERINEIKIILDRLRVLGQTAAVHVLRDIKWVHLLLRAIDKWPNFDNEHKKAAVVSSKRLIILKEVMWNSVQIVLTFLNNSVVKHPFYLQIPNIYFKRIICI